MGWCQRTSVVCLLMVGVALACGRSDLDPGEVGSPPGTNAARGGTSSQAGGASHGGGGKAGAPEPRGGQAGASNMAGAADAGAAGEPALEPNHFCSVDGWCWMNPQPQGNDLSVVLLLEGELYFGGDVGMLFRYDGTDYWQLESPTDEDIMGLWAQTPDDLWLVSEKHVFRRQGGKWQTSHATGDGFRAISGTSESDVYVVGTRLNHWDGQKWSEIELPEAWASGLWVEVAGKVWIGGRDLYLYDHGTFSTMAAPRRGVHDVWGIDDEVWAIGNSNLHCTRDGCVEFGLPTGLFAHIVGSSSKDIWAVGQRVTAHFDGTSWVGSELDKTLPVGAVSLDSEQRLVSAGPSGSIMRLEGDEWRELAPGNRSSLGDIWGAAADDVWLVGGGVYHSDGETLEARPFGDEWGISGVHGTAADDVWLVGWNGKIGHYDGQIISDYTVVPWEDPFNHFYGVYAASRSDVWAVGSWGLSYRFDGTQFQYELAGSGSRAVHGLSSDYVFAVDHYGVVERFDGSSWTEVVRAQPVTSLLDVWVSPSGTAWAAGGWEGHWGTLGRYGQDAWQSFELDDTPQFQGIFGFSDQDVWAAGYRKLLHFDGETWREENTGAGTTLTDVWGATPDDLWLIGYGGAVLRKKR